MQVAIMRLAGADPDIDLPSYQTEGAAGADIRANLGIDARVAGLRLLPRERVLVPTGFAVALPQGFEAQVRARSGLALRHGIALPNAPGTIDADYRGEVGVIVINLSDKEFVVRHGMRIAQMIIAPVVQVRFDVVDVLPDTARGTGGFGSTGTRS